MSSVSGFCDFVIALYIYMCNHEITEINTHFRGLYYR